MRVKHVLIPVIAVLILYQCVSDKSPQSPVAKTRAQMVESLFNYDGSNPYFVDAVKIYLRDPNSFEHGQTSFVDNGDNLSLTMVFRSKNGFGGLNVSRATGVCSLDGVVTNVKIIGE